MNKQKFLRRVLPLIVVVCLIGALGTVFYLRTIKEPPPTPDELWPEQGDVIATIDGKEYRYDQVYLFRLTGYWFPENYRESTLDPEHPIEVLGGTLARQQHTPYWGNDGAGYGVFWGDTWAENAVCMELLYQEGITRDKTNAETMMPKEDAIKEITSCLRDSLEFYSENYDTIPGIVDRVITGHEYPRDDVMIPFDRVAFQQGQSLNSYYRDNAPYIEKLYYLNECANIFLEKDNYLQIRDLLSQEVIEEANQELFLQYPGLRDDFLIPRLRDSLMEKYNVQMMTE